MFEVADFDGSYHAILGRPAYAKLLVIPKYTYVNLKMPGPHGVITMDAKFQQALLCKQDSCEQASGAVAAAELDELYRAGAKGPPDSNWASAFGTFKSAEDTKTIQVDPKDPAKEVQIGISLTEK